MGVAARTPLGEWTLTVVCMVFRSRTKNLMWYGVLGTKELLHRTYKNLEQKVLLEVSPTGRPPPRPGPGPAPGFFLLRPAWMCLQCDGRPIPLPSLQGIAVLNIPSYAGGTNFWGGTKEDDVRTAAVSLCRSSWRPPLSPPLCPPQTFTAPSFDDKILEVVAVFGSMQMAVSRVINLQHHRIAQVRPPLDTPSARPSVRPPVLPDLLCPPQCRTVKITILGDEGVPVQVDGEAWVQPPGYIKIIHKNRTQTLTRDRVSSAPGGGPVSLTKVARS